MNEQDKICPFMSKSTIYAPGSFSETVSLHKIKCLKESCGLWSETQSKCGLIKDLELIAPKKKVSPGKGIP